MDSPKELLRETKSNFDNLDILNRNYGIRIKKFSFSKLCHTKYLVTTGQ